MRSPSATWDRPTEPTWTAEAIGRSARPLPLDRHDHHGQFGAHRGRRAASRQPWSGRSPDGERLVCRPPAVPAACAGRPGGVSRAARCRVPTEDALGGRAAAGGGFGAAGPADALSAVPRLRPAHAADRARHRGIGSAGLAARQQGPATCAWRRPNRRPRHGWSRLLDQEADRRRTLVPGRRRRSCRQPGYRTAGSGSAGRNRPAVLGGPAGPRRSGRRAVRRSRNGDRGPAAHPGDAGHRRSGPVLSGHRRADTSWPERLLGGCSANC